MRIWFEKWQEQQHDALLKVDRTLTTLIFYHFSSVEKQILFIIELERRRFQNEFSPSSKICVGDMNFELRASLTGTDRRNMFSLFPFDDAFHWKKTALFLLFWPSFHNDEQKTNQFHSKSIWWSHMSSSFDGFDRSLTFWEKKQLFQSHF